MAFTTAVGVEDIHAVIERGRCGAGISAGAVYREDGHCRERAPEVGDGSHRAPPAGEFFEKCSASMET
jgi:hypothetical protein